MPMKDVIVNLPGFKLIKATGFNPIILSVQYKTKQKHCIHCNSQSIRIKASRIRRVRHESIGLRQTCLEFKAHKYYCRACQRYFNQRFPGILPYQRSTEKLKEQIFINHTHGISQTDLAKRNKLGKATMERFYQQYYQRHHQTLKQRDCPRVLGIDEHFFSKKQGYATILCDLRKHRIFDVIKGRNKQSLKHYFDQLPGKNNVQVVCMDLSSTYKSLVKHYFPNAKIVADRFHVIRLLNHLCMKTYQQIDPTLKYQRGLLTLFRRKPNHLSAHQQYRLEHYLEQQPASEAVYHFQQRLYRLLMKKHRTMRQCQILIPVFLRHIKQLKLQHFEALKTLGKTLYRWREEIVCIWRFTKSNGITEGFHRKMKLIQRRAYGFRNFENYRIRVKVLCS